MSTCTKCGNHYFKVEKNEPAASNFIVYFVQCSSCGSPIGVLEYANSAALLEGLEEKISKLTNEIQHISYGVTNIKNILERR